MRRATPCGLTGPGLVVGLAVAVTSVTYLVVEFSGPGERGPDF